MPAGAGPSMRFVFKVASIMSDTSSELPKPGIDTGESEPMGAVNVALPEVRVNGALLGQLVHPEKSNVNPCPAPEPEMSNSAEEPPGVGV